MRRKHFAEYCYPHKTKKFKTFAQKQNDLPVFAKGCDPFNYQPHVEEMAKEADNEIEVLVDIIAFLVKYNKKLILPPTLKIEDFTV